MSDTNRTITLEVRDQDFDFTLTAQDITKYFNSTQQTNKVAPAYNLLMGTVDQVQKATLKPLLANPVYTMTLASALVEEYAPDLGVIVKKPKSTPND